MRILIVVKDNLRQHLFLRMAQSELGEHWTATCLVGHGTLGPQPAHKRSLLDRARLAGQRIKGVSRAFWRPMVLPAIRPDSYREDEEFRDLLNIDPLPVQQAVNVYKTNDPNTPDALSFLCDQEPDLVLIFGAPILRVEWLNLPRLGALNMHYGILPFYRSGHSTEFALLHERPDRVGASIHYIDEGIDTGPTVKRLHVKPVPGELLRRTIARVYEAGARGLIECAKEVITSNQRLPQLKHAHATKGYYPSKSFTPDVAFGACWRSREASSPWPHTETVVEARLRDNSLPSRAWTAVETRILGSRRLPRTRLANGVYILLYHSLVGDEAKPWEIAYNKVGTPLRYFYQHLDWLIKEGFTPISLEDAPNILRRGNPKKQYFAVTFDDAYSNISLSTSYLANHRISPTIFVNGSFSTGRPYFRVLAAMLRDHGGTPTLQRILNERLPAQEWNRNPLATFNETKDFYVGGVMEEAVHDAYSEHFGSPADLHAHLEPDELRVLVKAGWTIGNHTWDHPTLSAINNDDAIMSIERNATFLKAEDLAPIDWLSFPNGLSHHVNQNTKDWMDAHPDIMGLFAGGGVNLFYSRTQWLRILFAGHDLRGFQRAIRHNVSSTFAAMTTA